MRQSTVGLYAGRSPAPTALDVGMRQSATAESSTAEAAAESSTAAAAAAESTLCHHWSAVNSRLSWRLRSAVDSRLSWRLRSAGSRRLSWRVMT